MPLPWMHFRPASMTLHFDESIMIGTRAISGSLAIRFRKRTIAAWLSSIASSMLMSMIWAPFSTCWRATDSASSKRPSRTMRAKAFEPVTLVRSPILTNSAPGSSVTGSRPDRRSGATVVVLGVSDICSGCLTGRVRRPAAHPRGRPSGRGERRCTTPSGSPGIRPEPGST